MKLFGRRLLAADVGERTKPPEGVAGADADRIGALMDAGGPDVNPELSGSGKYPVYDEMRKTDTSVRSTLWFFKLPIRSAVWDVEPATDDPADLLVADAVRWQFGLGDYPGQLNVSWKKSVDQALLVLDWGAMLEEIVWPKELRDFRDADGDTHQLRPISRLAPRPPSTIQYGGFKEDEQTGQIKTVKQLIPGTRPIPGEKLAYYVLEREGANWAGVSLLRPMWGAWRLKKELMIAAGIAWDRHGGGGLPEIRYPVGKRAEAEDIGSSVRLHEQGFVAFENDGTPEGQETGWRLKFHTVDLQDPIPLLRYYSESIAEAALQQWSKLGTTQTGARAVGQVLQDPFWLACESLAEDVAEDRTRQVVRRFVDVNFGARFDCPRLTVSKIQAEDAEAVARTAAEFANAGVPMNDLAAVNAHRARMNLPPLTAAELDAGGVPVEGSGLPRAPVEDLVRAAEDRPPVSVTVHNHPGEPPNVSVPVTLEVEPQHHYQRLEQHTDGVQGPELERLLADQQESAAEAIRAERAAAQTQLEETLAAERAEIQRLLTEALASDRTKRFEYADTGLVKAIVTVRSDGSEERHVVKRDDDGKLVRLEKERKRGRRR